MSLDQKITVDASGALTGVATLNQTIASIGEVLNKLTGTLGQTGKAFDELEGKVTKTLRTARDAANSLARAANDTVAAVQKATSGLASIDTALEKRVQRVRELRAELQQLAGTSFAGGGGRGRTPGGGGPGGNTPDPGSVARLGDLSRFGDQLTRQLLIIGQSRAFFALKDQIETATGAAKELNARITEIQTISQTASQSAEAWSTSLIKVSNELGRPVAEVADAAYQSLSNNIRGAQGNTEAFLLTVGNFARVTRTTFPGAVDAVSSVLNSYGQSISKAEDVTSKLFKAIELGRFRGEELANALGKTAPIASQLGVSLDDLLATFVALTREGQSLNTASTLTLNVFNSLLKPSTALAEFYRGQGVESGQQFIQVNGGLANALANVSSKSKGALGEITNLFSNLRSSRGIIGITNDIQSFNSAISDIKGSKGSFDIAIDIEKNSANRALDEFGQRLRNQTITAIGQGLLEIGGKLAKLDSKTGAISGFLLPAGEIAITVAAIGKIGSLLQTTSVVQNTILATAVQTSRVYSGIGDTLVGIGNNLGVFLALSTATFFIGEKIFKQSEAELLLIENFNTALRERSKLQQAGNPAAQAVDLKNIRDSFTSIQRAAALTSSSVVRQFEIARTNVRTSFEQVQGSLTSFLEHSRQTLQDINRDISRNLQEIDNSKKSLGDFRATAEKNFINLKLDLATPQQQFRILDDEIDRLSNKGKNLIIAGANKPGQQGDEQIREGRADLAEALKLAQQRVGVTQQIAKENGLVLSSTILLNQLEQDSLVVLNKKISAENSLQQIKEKQNQQLLQAKKDEQERLIRLQEQVKQFEKIQVEIASGDITKNKQFSTNGAFDPKEVERQLAVLGQTIKGALAESVGKESAASIVSFSRDVTAAQIAANKFLNEVTLDSNRKRLDTQLIQERAAAEERAKVISEAVDTVKNSFNVPTAGGLADANRQISAVTGTISKELNSTGGFLTQFGPASKNLVEVQRQLLDIRKLVDEIRSTPANEKGIIDIGADGLARLQAAQKAIETIITNNPNLKVGGINVQDTLQIAAKDISSATEQSRRLSQIIDLNQAAVNQISNLQSANTSEFKKALSDLTAITNSSKDAFGAALDALTKRINEAVNTNPGLPPVNGGGGLAPFAGNFSHGGTVTGMDTMIAGVRPGEVILSPTASRAFASQLQSAMNTSHIPYGEGSSVSVGDVNVFVSGANTAQQNVRAIGNELRRELRRGNLRL